MTENLNALWKKQRKADPTIKGRRARELKPLPAAARRQMRGGETKSVQMKLWITPTLRSKVAGMAMAKHMSMAELFELAIEKLSEDV